MNLYPEQQKPPFCCLQFICSSFTAQSLSYREARRSSGVNLFPQIHTSLKRLYTEVKQTRHGRLKIDQGKIS